MSFLWSSQLSEALDSPGDPRAVEVAVRGVLDTDLILRVPNVELVLGPRGYSVNIHIPDSRLTLTLGRKRSKMPAPLLWGENLACRYLLLSAVVAGIEPQPAGLRENAWCPCAKSPLTDQ